MRKHVRFTLWLIIALTIITVLIDLPRIITVSVNSKIPLINKQLVINQSIQGFNPELIFGPFGIQRDLAFKKGLDLQGGTSVTLLANMKGIPASQQDQALSSAQLVIERRVNALGVSEPVVQTSQVGSQRRIDVELPGVTDINQAVQLIGATAQLTFWEEGAANSATPSASSVPSGILSYLPHAHKTNLTGNDLSGASVTFAQNNAQPQVQLTFTPDGTKKFADITTRNVGKPLAMVLDNQLLENPPPTVNQPILTGNAVITGSFTTDEANLLATALQAGALPVPLSILSQQAIGATLGQSSLNASLFAGILGFIVIILFMCLLYGRLGMIASLALTLYTLVVIAIFKLIPVTLTLAGIAGFILSIGMAVDANILIFERMREEMRAGRSRETAIELGFSRAWTSIRDSNISSLITSAILYKFGTGIVRGFALTLAIGVIVSMFSAIIVTRTFLRLLYKA